MTTSSLPPGSTAPAVIPVLLAAFVILYGFPGETMQLWTWMVCPDMNALLMGGGYRAGAYFFTGSPAPVVAAVRARGEFSTEGWATALYTVSLVLALALNLVLYVAMERRARERQALST